MGYIPVEQTVAIIEAVCDTIDKTQETTNYWWSLLLVIVPVILGVIFKKLFKR